MLVGLAVACALARAPIEDQELRSASTDTSSETMAEPIYTSDFASRSRGQAYELAFFHMTDNPDARGGDSARQQPGRFTDQSAPQEA